jgi:hypothetical protein
MNIRAIMRRAVIFDLGGVYFSDGTRQASDKIAAGYGIDRQAVAGFLNGEARRKLPHRPDNRRSILAAGHRPLEHPGLGRGTFDDLV